MERSSDANVKLSAQSEEYARALRVIGQDLADLFPERVKIETAGDRFLVCGKGRGKSQRMVRNGSVTVLGLKKLLRRNSAAEAVDTSLSIIHFTRSYTAEDINLLEERGIFHRKPGGASKPELYDLSEHSGMIG